ncbi:UxaA family hydrolase [Natronobiforma cellulositropha]|uniref:UxaA family hydrolase n=1 Tax=Natronobiforma cellulositropha TaxID=1679076 RepID=UPI0021D573E4|nr:UxaA family hydrolase [Natronobiforma cellulositropha]
MTDRDAEPDPGEPEAAEGDAATRAAISLDPTDTVVTLLEDVSAGEWLTLEDGEGRLELREDVPFGHKVAVVGHDSGDAVRKYGEPIGVATDPIPAGAWVHTHNCDSVRGKATATEAEAEAEAEGDSK